jgi:uncharacterized membrane protein YeiH
MVTAVFGGVLRDIVCNEIPAAFSDHRPYALLAFAGGWVLVGAQGAGLPGDMSLALAVAFTTAARLLALWRDWRLPAWRVSAKDDQAN